MHIIQVETGELVVAAEDYSICCSIEGEDMEKLKSASDPANRQYQDV